MIELTKDDARAVGRVVEAGWLAVVSAGRYVKNGKMNIDSIASNAQEVGERVAAILQRK